MDRITCDVAKDIMPLCIDGICSENSKQLVEAHIKECTSCKKLWDSYCNSTIVETIKEDSVKTFKDLALQLKKKNRRKIIFSVFGTICISIIMMISFGLIILGIFSLGTENFSTIDISNYGKYEGHIEAEKKELRSGLYIFPKEISKNAKGVKFLYTCSTAGFGTEYQQFLKCTYSNKEYKVEINRLKNIKCKINTKKKIVVNHIEYSTTKFSTPAYIAVYASNSAYEYALCNKKTKTIVYVYLQMIKNSKVAFNKKYLPLDCQNGKQLLSNNKLNNKNIYHYYIGNGVYMNFRDKVQN